MMNVNGKSEGWTSIYSGEMIPLAIGFFSDTTQLNHNSFISFLFSVVFCVTDIIVYIHKF